MEKSLFPIKSVYLNEYSIRQVKPTSFLLYRYQLITLKIHMQASLFHIYSKVYDTLVL